MSATRYRPIGADACRRGHVFGEAWTAAWCCLLRQLLTPKQRLL